MTVHLRVMTKQGHVADLEFDKILAIDGEPYRIGDADVRDTLLHHDGRITALERLLGAAVTEEVNHGGV